MKKQEQELMERLAINVAIYRAKANLSSKKLSQVIGKSADYIDNLENLKLKRIPALYVIIAICLVLKVNLDDLIGKNYIESLLKES